jgi:cytoskeleton protein RodZ
MSDEIGAGVDAPSASDAPMGFGAQLASERERLGLSVIDVAGRLRLHPNQVRALEREALTELPEAAYVRGFVRSYARVLNIDPASLLADLAQKLAPPADSVVDGMVQERDYSPVREASREHASRRIVLAGAVLLLVALGALGWYATTHRPSTKETTSAPPPPSAPPAASMPPTTAAAPAAVASTPAPQPTNSAGPDETPAVTEAIAPPPLLKLRFTGSSWVEVKDAEGKVLLSQNSAAGAEFVIEGTPPYYVVIGDAGKAVVEVRGEIYDLASQTRQNVARFTVN